MDTRGWMVLSCLVVVRGASTCSRDLPAEMVRDLWRKTEELITCLPKEDSRGLRLLPVYCTNLSVCPKALEWSEVGHVLMVYQKRVFKSDVINKLLPLHFQELLHRLTHTLHNCAPSQKRSKTVNQFEKKIKHSKGRRRKRRDEVIFKAVREFLFVLRWIDELRQQDLHLHHHLHQL